MIIGASPIKSRLTLLLSIGILVITASHTVPIASASPQLIAQMPIEFQRKRMLQESRRARAVMEEQTALKILNQWLDKHPDDYEVLFERAELYKYMEKFPEAIADFKQSIKIKDILSSGNSYWGMGESYDRLGKTAEATKAFAEAAKILGNHPDLLFKLCRRSVKIKDAKTAIALADQLLAKNIEEAHNLKAAAYCILNKDEKAVTEYSILIPAASKIFKHQGSASSATYKSARILREALDGRALCYDRLGKPDLAESDRQLRQKMDRDIFEETPFLQK